MDFNDFHEYLLNCVDIVTSSELLAIYSGILALIVPSFVVWFLWRAIR